MASPEVSRPMTSPVRGPPAGGSSSSRKVVTFGTDSRPAIGAGDHQHAAAARQRSKSGHQKRDAGKDENSETKRAPFPQPVTSNQFSSSRKAFRPESRPLRKRSYSFSEGHSKGLQASNSKRWKFSCKQNKEGDLGSKVDPGDNKANNIQGNKGGGGGGGVGKKSKFLLGGNIRDPLNLNSLSDERVSRAFNAVTPESSPMPTPKHRKPEYKIEVLIPPNISDPLGLGSEQSEYESQLLSPTFPRNNRLNRQKAAGGGGVGMHTKDQQYRHRKRTRGGGANRHATRQAQTDHEDYSDSGGGASEPVAAKVPPATASDDEPPKAREEKEQPAEPASPAAAAASSCDPAAASAAATLTVASTEPSTVPTATAAVMAASTAIPTAQTHWKKPKRPRKKAVKAPASSAKKDLEIVSPVVMPGGQGTTKRRFHHPKHRRSSQGHGKNQKRPTNPPSAAPSTSGASTGKSGSKRCFEYGNYNRYYGYRNVDSAEDHRLKFLNPEWFRGKDVLDIGCNVGHMTLAVARAFQPRSILGVDIDESLIKMARTNVKHYSSCIMPPQGTPSHQYTPGHTPRPVSAEVPPTPEDEVDQLFPVSLPILYGPVDPTNPSMVPGSVRDSDHSSRASKSNQGGCMPFPQNVRFAQTNYVLESDDLLDAIQPEYDAIMCLSTTKWMHLNFGDEGLKRAFRRMHAQLRHGGKLILEAQGFGSYRKRKNLTQRIRDNFQNIQLRPEAFHDYLVHEVAFSVGETIAVPHHSAQGFQRPLQVFTKLPPFSSRSASSCHTTPYYYGGASSSRHNTPYYFPPSPAPGMYYGYSSSRQTAPTTPRAPPCYAPIALTPMHGGWNDDDGDSRDQPPDSTASPANPSYSPTPGVSYSASNTPTYGPQSGSAPNTPAYSPSGAGGAGSTPTPAYSPSGAGAGSTPGYSASNTPTYGPQSGSAPNTPAYSPSGAGGAGSTPTPAYSPSGAGAGSTPGYSASNTPTYGPQSGSAPNTPAYSPSGAQGAGSTPAPTYSPSEAGAGSTTPGSHYPSNTPTYGPTAGSALAYSPSGAGGGAGLWPSSPTPATSGTTPTGSEPPSTSNSPFGNHGSPYQ